MLTEMRKVLSLTQEETLQPREGVSINRTPLVTTFNPHTTFIAEIANRNWHFLQSKERLVHIFQEPPLIAWRRPKSLRNTLVSSKLRNNYWRNDNIAGGCGPCDMPRCSWCSRINKTSILTATQNCKVYHLSHTMDCQSGWVIYVIECKICKLQYIGKSETGFNLFFLIFFLTALLTITHVTYNKVNNQEEIKYKCKVI